ncbi:acyl-coenzyme A synthetase ACSM1, mitochondrial-like [Talpa occidentalis]|uniref:acyl-coenzyme A synthetase ACSM1, mitochondrial-like n=1 Tax=Talpa occidentalis TaxID=50954 RepID=UPI0023F67002|nr:acyl-coenzyme A synthetase ACSM1, mitochondrial-like [Talpa occidentalis]
MRGQFQLFSLVRCARMGRGACCKPKRKFATWTFRSLDHRTLGQAVPQHFNFAKDVLDHWSQLEKDGHREAHPALWEVNTEGEEDKWSFERMSHFSQKAASILSDTCGLNRGDRLMIILGPAPETYCIFLACVQLGITFVPGTPQMTAKEILYQLHTSKAQCIVVNKAVVPLVDSVLSNCPTLKTKLLVSDKSYDGWLDFRDLMRSASPEHTCVKSKTSDPMVIFFTSGTTGYPKMAKHSHGLALRSSFPSRRLLQLKTSDVFWCLSDPGWILAVLGCLLEPWTAGSTLFIHHLSQFEPKVIVETFFKYPITQCIAAPGVYRMILQKNFPSLRFPCLEHCCTGGEPLLPEEQEQWRQRTGILIHEAYGQSETALSCANLRDMKPMPGSMGKAIPPYDVQIIDSKGNVLPPNTEGNIGIRVKPIKPIGLFMCYENDPAKTAEVECGDFYNTGDRATMDEEGYFWFLGRSDDVINASGYRIGPAEVENALAEHPAVAESAVVGSPDPTRGEVVKAFVVLTQQFMTHDQAQLTKELQEHVKSVTAPYKYPRKVEFVPELPKTVTGKIRRSELRKRELGQK